MAWLGPPGDYQLTRWLILRLLGVVYLFAFLGMWFQGPPLIGPHGLTPMDPGPFWAHPSVFCLGDSDGAIRAWAALGIVLSLACVAGYANLPSMLLLWVVYGSFERDGGRWFGFGWEILLLETGFLASFLVHPWDPRPLAARQPPVSVIVLLRWLAFRIYLGAGLIKWRSDPCWRELTCLDTHFETQPLPNPLSPGFHHAPHVVHAAGVVMNHVVELILPWFAFGPRVVRLVAGIAMIGFQVVLVLSGNLAFLNWLTIVPAIALLDDRFLRRLIPKRFTIAVAPRARLGHRVAAYAVAALVVVKSCDVVENLASHHQAMNASYDRLSLVNTYGAFGTVETVRHELVVEGTMDDDPATARWEAYEFPCKPGDVTRRPCILGPYHRRLDWLMWFAAFDEHPRDPWLIHFVWKLLAGDDGVRTLLAVDPFDGAAPKWVRIQRWVYRLQGYGDDGWWVRDDEQSYLPPVSKDTEWLQDVMSQLGWSE